jgi:Aspartyl protease
MSLARPSLLGTTALVLLLFSASASAAEPTNCKLSLLTTVELVNAGDLIAVPVAINGHEARMFLDTARAYSSTWRGAAELLDLAPKPLRVDGRLNIGGVPVTEYATVSLKLGHVTIKDVQVMLDPTVKGQPPKLLPHMTVGVLGLGGFFAAADVELDFPQHVMRLYSQDHCPGRVVTWSSRYDVIPYETDALGNLHFPMELDGKKLETTLSTGSANTVLHEDVAAKIYGFDHKSPGIDTTTDPTGHTRSHYRAMELTNDNINIMNARVELLDAPGGSCYLNKPVSPKYSARYTGCYNIFPLGLGMNVLNKLHLYIATKEKKLYFTVADPTASNATTSASPAASATATDSTGTSTEAPSTDAATP